jgi:hypothetical protein
MEQFKFLIGDDEELSKCVQRILFMLGYKWKGNETIIVETHQQALYADSDGYITYSDASYYHSHNTEDSKPVDIDWLRTPKVVVEYVELGGKKYIKSELEEALSKIVAVDVDVKIRG